MKNIKSILTFFLILNFVNIYANKDRIEAPQSFKFIFKNNEVIILKSTDIRLKKYCDEIVSRKRKIIEAQLRYKTGEIITAKYDGKNWSCLKIRYKNKERNVPKNILRKITQIHFSTLNLIWSSDNEIAFNSSYFLMDFEVGTVKYFNKLPNLNLLFEDSMFFGNKKFSKCTLQKQVGENATQIFAF
ncbi:hypothetical protein [Flavobacterium collinsii]|uniref:Uncharacterized protein n=1 Tax=Flavobacterium collinsii TaxID=1114861 RepID=A0A9W4TG31_9FLAO|nr:hypothetical protein [Flavobacterium collinsii]GIQ57629.1 hypothetical protein Flavo103_07650 [Flavobacterium collinsii]CAI2766885.1 conserved protein of unknown function [Flavobacterium collinsii]